jgi:phosphatidylinositol-3-phosphatase
MRSRNTIRRVGASALTIGTALATAACSSGGDHADIGGPQYAALENATMTTAEQAHLASADHNIKTVFLIMMENHNWDDIAGSASAPYINGSLLANGAHAENYFDNPKAVHPSEPNYIWLEAGDNLGITDDNGPEDNYRTTRMHLTSLLDNANVSWKSYQEDISGTECPLDGSGLYEPKHNPMVFFTDFTSGSEQSASCIAHVRPYTELASDLADDTVARYNLITPNLCNDMHNSGGCASGDSIKNGDSWLASELPKILASSAYLDGGAVFITWDESEGGEQPIGMIVLSPFAKAGYANAIRYTHSSMLRTAQEIFAVQPLLRDAANATSLSDLFTAYP